MYCTADLSSASVRSDIPPRDGMLPCPLIAEATAASIPVDARLVHAARSPIFGAPLKPAVWQLPQVCWTICWPVRAAGLGRCSRSLRLLEFRARLIRDVDDSARDFDRVKIGIAALGRHRLESFDGVLDERVVALLNPRGPCRVVPGLGRPGGAGRVTGTASELVNGLAALQGPGAGWSACKRYRSDRPQPFADGLGRKRFRACTAHLLPGNERDQQNDQDHRDDKRQDDHGDQLAWGLDRRSVWVARHGAPDGVGRIAADASAESVRARAKMSALKSAQV